jgi:hypothetical protein
LINDFHCLQKVQDKKKTRQLRLYKSASRLRAPVFSPSEFSVQFVKASRGVIAEELRDKLRAAGCCMGPLEAYVTFLTPASSSVLE